MSPAYMVVTGTADPNVAPLLVAAWASAVLRLTDEYQLRQDIVAEVAEETGTAPSTTANLFRSAVLAGVVDQEIHRNDRGHPRAFVRLPQPIPSEEIQ